MYTSIIILSVWLHRDRHRALRPRIHQPLLLDSEERHVPPTCSTTQGDKRQWLCQNSLVLHVGLPGHAKDRPGEFYPSLSFGDPDKLQQTPGMSGISCKSHFLYFIQTFIIVTQRKLFFVAQLAYICILQPSVEFSMEIFFFFFQHGILDNEMSFSISTLLKSSPGPDPGRSTKSEREANKGYFTVCKMYLCADNT